MFIIFVRTMCFRWDSRWVFVRVFMVREKLDFTPMAYISRKISYKKLNFWNKNYANIRQYYFHFRVFFGNFKPWTSGNIRNYFYSFFKTYLWTATCNGETCIYCMAYRICDQNCNRWCCLHNTVLNIRDFLPFHRRMCWSHHTAGPCMVGIPGEKQH